LISESDFLLFRSDLLFLNLMAMSEKVMDYRGDGDHLPKTIG
jgi:hypothetical protein